MQWAGIEEHFSAGQQRGKQPHRQAKGVEQRQRRHKPVVRGKVGNAFDLLNVCQNALVAVDDAFWVAFRTRREEDNRVIFRLLFDWARRGISRCAKSTACRRWSRPLSDLPEDPAHLSELLGKMPELAFVRELAGGEYGIDLRSGYRAGQPLHARRVVHHRRNTAPETAPKITAALMPALGSIRPIFSPFCCTSPEYGPQTGFWSAACDRYPE